jgi:mannose-6-phosphate isomerase
MSNVQAIRIQGQVQAYQWGGKSFLPELLGYRNESELPQAEYWLGAHPSARAVSVDDKIPLDELLAAHRAAPLQFLLKILDVQDMLSIQAHPNKQQAREGFARENAHGIALDAKNRNYKDASDKPELMVALSEFWLLHGFRDIQTIADLLAAHPCLAGLRTILLQDGLVAAFSYALDFASADVQTMQHELAQSLRNPPESFAKDTPEFWIQRWLEKNPQVENGVLTLFFLNLLKLEPGMAMYQPAGLLHAYLEGQNVELMANSDNVLRAGLTPKHIDVAELLRTCSISPSRAEDFIIAPQTLANGEIRYVTPFEEFELTEIIGTEGTQVDWRVEAPEILFCYHGRATLQTDGQADTQSALPIAQGESALLLPGLQISLQTNSPNVRFFKARNLP